MKALKCPLCGDGELAETRETRRYGRGIDVTLVNVPVRRCPTCGEEMVMIPAIEELHRQIAHELARSGRRLRPGEVRFLRTYLGYSSSDFAAVMGVVPETVSRWESARSAQAMSPTADRLLRLMAQQDRPIAAYALDSSDAAAPDHVQPLRLSRTSQGWAAA
jgi:putative zinc finger/helix-turn-helix YgiT family protein